jgi:hypothetical protein
MILYLYEKIIIRMNIYSFKSKELPKATTQEGTPRSNIVS